MSREGGRIREAASGFVSVIRVDLAAPGIEPFVTLLDPEAVAQGYQYRMKTADTERGDRLRLDLVAKVGLGGGGEKLVLVHGEFEASRKERDSPRQLSQGAGAAKGRLPAVEFGGAGGPRAAESAGFCGDVHAARQAGADRV